MNDVLSRAVALIGNDGVTHLCDYTFLGLGSIVQTNSPQPNLTSTLIGIAGGNDPVTGDIYRDLDTFGQVRDLIWTAGSGLSSSKYFVLVGQRGHEYRRANPTWFHCVRIILAQLPSVFRLSKLQVGSS